MGWHVGLLPVESTTQCTDRCAHAVERPTVWVGEHENEVPYGLGEGPPGIAAHATCHAI